MKVEIVPSYASISPILWFKLHGRPYMVWEKLSGVRNEPLDISVYALAGAYLVGISRIDWKGEDTVAGRVPQREMSVEEEKLIVSSPDVENQPLAPTANKRSNVRRRRGRNLVDRY